TLMKILSGALRKDSGSILVDGAETDITTPASAQAAGIGMIYQDFKLVPELSVGEDILLGNEPRQGKTPFIDFSLLHSQAKEILQSLGESLDTRTPVIDLSIAQRQLTEIARALSRRVRVLAMDEPSAALTDRELQNLFNVIRKLKSEGVGII